MYGGDAPSAFRIPISRVRSRIAVYMARKTTRNPKTTESPMITRVNDFSIGMVSVVIWERKSSMLTTM